MSNLDSQIKSTLSVLSIVVLSLAGCSAELPTAPNETEIDLETPTNSTTVGHEKRSDDTELRPLNTSELVEHIDRLTREIMAKEMIPGAAVVLVRDGRVLHQQGYGVSDAISKRPVDPNKTVFRIGSVSKALTALAVSRLADRGKIHMNDPVQTHFPPFAQSVNSGGGDQPVRIWHLLTHSAGLDQIGIGRHIWGADKTLDERLAERPTLSEFLANKNLRRTSPPGQHYRYDTYAITLAGAVLERVTGIRYHEAMVQELFAPLGMNNSSVALDPSNRENLALGHGFNEGKYTQAPYEVYVTQPASSIDATPADMARLMQALTAPNSPTAGKWLSNTMLAKILEPQYRPHAGFAGTSHGFQESFLMDVAFAQPVRTLGHGGSMLGFQTSLTIVPEIKLAIAVFTNRNSEAGGDWVSLHNQLNRLAIGSFFTGDAFKGFDVPTPDRTRDLSEYAGDYFFGVFCRTCTKEEFRSGGWPAGEPLTVNAIDGGLRLGDHAYFPSTDHDVFVQATGLNKIAFGRNEAGSIAHFSFYTSPDTFERREPDTH